MRKTTALIGRIVSGEPRQFLYIILEAEIPNFFEPPKSPKIGMEGPNMPFKPKFANCFSAPESIPQRDYYLKLEPIWTMGLDCRGGAIYFGAPHLVNRAMNQNESENVIRYRKHNHYFIIRQSTSILAEIHT